MISLLNLDHDGQAQHRPPQFVPSISTGQRQEGSTNEEEAGLKEDKEEGKMWLAVSTSLSAVDTETEAM